MKKKKQQHIKRLEQNLNLVYASCAIICNIPKTIRLVQTREIIIFPAFCFLTYLGGCFRVDDFSVSHFCPNVKNM